MSEEFTSLNFLYKRQLVGQAQFYELGHKETSFPGLIPLAVQFLIVELYNQKATQNAGWWVDLETKLDTRDARRCGEMTPGNFTKVKVQMSCLIRRCTKSEYLPQHHSIAPD